MLPALVACALTDSSVPQHLLRPVLQVQFETQQAEHFVPSQKPVEWHTGVLLASLSRLQEVQNLHRSTTASTNLNS